MEVFVLCICICFMYKYVEFNAKAHGKGSVFNTLDARYYAERVLKLFYWELLQFCQT